MRKMPEFVREDEGEKEAVRPAVTANLTGWETVIFQVVEEPESDSASATAAFAP
jgi:hypothetical protein